MFVGLNPSTAAESVDDPTIRRCVSFARDWGYTGLCMTNLFAFRATKPTDLFRASEPFGPDNDHHLLDAAQSAGVIVAAWGVAGVYRGRDEAVRELLPKMHYLKFTKDGHPAHPLYLPKTANPKPWKSRTDKR